MKSVLVANLQSSLDQINLHLKDEFWYQVELEEESSMSHDFVIDS